MIEVNVRDNESLEKALRRFKKKWERSGVLKEVKRKSFYEKPSVTKRIARKQTLRRIHALQNSIINIITVFIFSKKCSNLLLCL
ncbi:MAG: hypothetical protein Ct9H90mP15_00310 [Candidatus Neomarinimicrobiota bacterium]|nr:MAG: hypothetical protein Ct9H90mP15_00310 [Candidatus Neomarinimicrobiota bacterium]